MLEEEQSKVKIKIKHTLKEIIPITYEGFLYSSLRFCLVPASIVAIPLHRRLKRDIHASEILSLSLEAYR